MTQTLLAATLAATLLAGPALAADAPKNDGFRIESEDQFVRDYGDLVERAAPGVYQIVKGPLAGKTIAMGEAGLAYDLAVLRARMPTAPQARAAWQAEVRRLEDTRTRLARQDTGVPTTSLKSTGGALQCQYWPIGGQPILYYGIATVSATAELYLDSGDGTPNPYYARASARASGTVYAPPGVPASVSLYAYATAQERYRGTTITRSMPGLNSAAVSTGYVYSGPAFFHDLFASSSVSGRGNCYGYVGVSDSMTPDF